MHDYEKRKDCRDSFTYGNFEEAIQNCKEFLEYFPGDPEIERILKQSRMYERLQRDDHYYAYFNKLLAKPFWDFNNIIHNIILSEKFSLLQGSSIKDFIQYFMGEDAGYIVYFMESLGLKCSPDIDFVKEIHNIEYIGMCNPKARTDCEKMIDCFNYAFQDSKQKGVYGLCISLVEALHDIRLILRSELLEKEGKITMHDADFFCLCVEQIFGSNVTEIGDYDSALKKEVLVPQLDDSWYFK